MGILLDMTEGTNNTKNIQVNNKTSKKIITWNRKRLLILLICLIITIFVCICIGNIKSIIAVLGIAIIGVLLPQLFDVTELIIALLKKIENKTNPEIYRRTIQIYNDRLRNFACNFYFFLAEISTEEKRKILMNNGIDTNEKIIESLQNFLRDGQPNFYRIKKDDKETFSDSSHNYFMLAEGELSDIYRILKSLPQELEFTYKRHPEFINLQSGFYQVKNTLSQCASSRACEALTEALIKDVIKYLQI